MSEEQKDQQVLQEPVEKSTEKVEEQVDPRELELAKEHGFIEGKDPEPETKPEPEQKTKLDPKTEQEQKPEPEAESDEKNEIKEKIKAGEDLSPEEEQKVHEFSLDEKAMYWKWKGEKQKRQTEAKKREFTELKSKLKDQKIKEQEELIQKLKDGELSDEDSGFITRAEAEEIARKNAAINKDGTFAKAPEKIEAEYKSSIADQLAYQEMAKNRNFDKIQSKFQEIVQKDQNISNEFLNRIDRLGSNDFAGDDLINFVYRSVERSGYKVEDFSKKAQEEKVSRIIENSSKPPSAAAISTGTNPSKTLEEYTRDDVEMMPDEDYNTLSDKEREYLLRKFS